MSGERRVLVASLFGSLTVRWEDWGDVPLDEVFEKLTERAQKGKANSLGFRVSEVAFGRTFEIRPEISRYVISDVADAVEAASA